MNKPIILVASLSLIGAGSLVYWQSQRPEPTPQETITQPVVKPATTRAPRPATQTPSLVSRITDSSLRYEVRVDALRRLDAKSLTPQEIDTLYTLLNHTPKAGHEESWWVVVNEIMEQMRKQAIAPERYTPAMLAIIRDENAPEVLRDYAIQHLGQWVTPRGAEQGYPSEENPQLVQETARTLGRTITDATIAHTSIPGTTLMVMVDMLHGGVPEPILTPILTSLQPWFQNTISGVNNTAKITRISAINAIAMLDLQEHSPSIRKLAESDQTDPSIRLNSIAALGRIGQAKDLDFLQSIASGDTKYRHAAKAALTKLSKKNQL